MKNPVVRTFGSDQPPKDYQTAELLPLPSKEVLQEIGWAAIRFGQLEQLLKVIYKRSDKDVSLDPSLEKSNGGSLGVFLNGIRRGETVEFEGLRKLAQSNSQLACVQYELSQAEGLSKTRKRYVHNGIGRIAGGNFVFLHTGEPIEESKMCAELGAASTLAESLLSEINKRSRRQRAENNLTGRAEKERVDVILAVTTTATRLPGARHPHRATERPGQMTEGARVVKSI